MKRKLITIIDVVIIVFVVVFSLAFSMSLFKNQGTVAIVSVNDKVKYELPLSVNTHKTITTEHGYNKILVKNGKISVLSADCRDGICISRGEINKKGQSIVCLPHKMIIEIK